MSLLSKFREYRERKKKLRELIELSGRFRTLEALEKGGQLLWDPRNRRLLIERPLALLMMRSAAHWQNFMQNVHQWVYFRACQLAWAEFMRDEELKAVRKATMTDSHLTRPDIERIKNARREEIAMSDMEPPKIEPFEFYIINVNDNGNGDNNGNDNGLREAPEHQLERKSGNERTNGSAVGKTLAVGRYDPESGFIDMATWEEVERFLK